VGIATGPLVGSLLGGISWRGPFFGVTTLMPIALIATPVSARSRCTWTPTSLAW